MYDIMSKRYTLEITTTRGRGHLLYEITITQPPQPPSYVSGGLTYSQLLKKVKQYRGDRPSLLFKGTKRQGLEDDVRKAIGL